MKYGSWGEWPVPYEYEENDLNNIEILPNVVTTQAILRTATAIDPYMKGLEAKITSGKRTIEDQMRIIVQKVLRHGIDKVYHEWQENIGKPINEIVQVGNERLFFWQRAWSKLLNISDIVNPPIPAEVLFDYFRPGSSVNGKGRIIGLSPHMEGNAFDLAGNDLTKLRQKIEFCKENSQSFIKDFLIEDVNNCAHIDCIPI